MVRNRYHQITAVYLDLSILIVLEV